MFVYLLLYMPVSWYLYLCLSVYTFCDAQCFLVAPAAGNFYYTKPQKIIVLKYVDL